MALRTIFAERVFGSSGTNTIRDGLNALPRCSATSVESSSASPSLAPAPGLVTTKHQMASPLTSSGMPTAADSATAG